MSLEKIITDGNFKSEVLEAKQPVLVDFWAEWCGPCKMLSPVVERIAKANQGKLVVGKMNVDENQQTPQQFGIQGIPTLILFKGGSAVSRLVGYQSQENIQRAVDDAIHA